MKRIKLMADYECFPLWETSPGTGNIDPDTLPISQNLKNDLNAWAKSYDETLNHSDPLNSGFNTENDEKAFHDKACELSNKLQEELGEDFLIIMET